MPFLSPNQQYQSVLLLLQNSKSPDILLVSKPGYPGRLAAKLTCQLHYICDLIQMQWTCVLITGACWSAGAVRRKCRGQPRLRRYSQRGVTRCPEIQRCGSCRASSLPASYVLSRTRPSSFSILHSGRPDAAVCLSTTG